MFKVNLTFFAKSNKELEAEVKALKESLKMATNGDTQALADKIIEDAKEEAEKIKSDAKIIIITSPSDEKSVEEYIEERVPVTLYKDGEKYKDDVTISVNGEIIQIQRGKQVFIKRKHAMVLENKYSQEIIAADMSTQLADEFSGREKQLL